MSSSDQVPDCNKKFLLPWVKISKLVTKHKQHMTPEEIINDILKKSSKLHQKTILRQIVDSMEEFHVQLYYSKRQSKVKCKFDSFVAEEERSRQTVNMRIDALLFFYRNVGHEPEIYALTTGCALKLLKGHIDCGFPKYIGRRILGFHLKVLSSKHLFGDKISSYANYWQTESETFLSFWDCLGDITNKYQMPVKKQSSVYTLLTGNKERVVNVEISEDSITFHKRLSWLDISELLTKMSAILDGFVTDAAMDKDDPRFDVFDHVKRVNTKAEMKKYDDKLKTLLAKSLKLLCNPLRLRLMYKDVESWVSADEFLLVMPRAAGTFIQKWEGSPPTLESVLGACRRYAKEKKIHDAALGRLVNDVSIQFACTDTGTYIIRGKAKLTDLIEGHLHTDTGISVFRYCGKWFRIHVEYLTQVEELFSKVMGICNLEQDKLPLPWLYSSSDSKVANVDTNDIKYWITQLNFSECCNPIEDKADFNDFLLNETNVVKVEKQLMARLFSKQREREYNSGYILYNKIPSKRTNGESGFLLGDNILMKNIELFDLLYYTPECTYLIHVKNGFGNSFRDVCSQIRISADFLHCCLNATNRFNFLKEFWKIAANRGKTTYREAVRQMYREVGWYRFEQMFHRKICFVLAYRDIKKSSQRRTFSSASSKKLTKHCGEDTDRLLRNLALKDFLEERQGTYYLTDKIFKLKADIVKDIINVTTRVAKKVASILKERVSKSFISKMEFVQLYSYFRKYSIGNGFSLRICRIQNHTISHFSLPKSSASPVSDWSNTGLSEHDDRLHTYEFHHQGSDHTGLGQQQSHDLQPHRPRSDSQGLTSSGSLTSGSSDHHHHTETSDQQKSDSERLTNSGSLASHSGDHRHHCEKSDTRKSDTRKSDKRKSVRERLSSSGLLASCSGDHHHHSEKPDTRKSDKWKSDSERLTSSGLLASCSGDHHHHSEKSDTRKSDKRKSDSERLTNSGLLASCSGDHHHHSEKPDTRKSDKRKSDSERLTSSGLLASCSGDHHHHSEKSDTRKSDKRKSDSERLTNSGSLASRSDQLHHNERFDTQKSHTRKSDKWKSDSERLTNSGLLASCSGDHHHHSEKPDTRKSDKRKSDSERLTSSGSLASHSGDKHHHSKRSDTRTSDTRKSDKWKSDSERSISSEVLASRSDQLHHNERFDTQKSDTRKSDQQKSDSERLTNSGLLASCSGDHHHHSEKPDTRKSDKRKSDSERLTSSGLLASCSGDHHHHRKKSDTRKSDKRKSDSERLTNSGLLASCSGDHHHHSEKPDTRKPDKRKSDSERLTSSGLLASCSGDHHHHRKKSDTRKSDKRKSDSERLTNSGSLASRSDQLHHNERFYTKKSDTRKSDKRKSDSERLTSSGSLASRSDQLHHNERSDTQKSDTRKSDKRKSDSERLTSSGLPASRSGDQNHHREASGTQKSEMKRSTQQARKRKSDRHWKNDSRPFQHLTHGWQPDGQLYGSWESDGLDQPSWVWTNVHNGQQTPEWQQEGQPHLKRRKV
ncbi:uncharacterized protein LOC124147546 [Haliotis rufescens]|uniref:uncharacterized protein LOC124147546 n=1 Tax=Haliotis rufescens TaxID=6454 RepID=UPI00201F1A95|nr:uncharacterized protein LOC124147546 [Haliotis rufescens]